MKAGVLGDKIRPFSVVICGTLTLLMLSVFVSQMAQVGASSSGGYTPHAPISIVGDNSFTTVNGVTGGSGTENDPYIIENWVIDASSAHGIQIQNTTKYFVVRNCLVENGGDFYDGIYLDFVSNGKIENNTCRNNEHGIYLMGQLGFPCNNNTLTNNICSNNKVGIDLVRASTGNTISNNTCENNFDYGIRVYGSGGNELINNTCSGNTYGIFLSVFPPQTTPGIYYFSSNNTISNNTCKNNSYGIYSLWGSSNNTIFHNYLLNNTENNAYDNWHNYWDNGSEGNYWDDWQPPEHPDADEDGIVDETRPIAGGANKDNYPLVLTNVTFTTTTTTSPPTTTPAAEATWIWVGAIIGAVVVTVLVIIIVLGRREK